jgi:hypothetical protein
METALAKTEETKTGHAPSGAVPEVQPSPREELGALAGMPLFLQRFALSAAPILVQRQVGEEEDEEPEEAEEPIRAKLTIGQPGDVYEQEADQVAEQVIQSPRPGREHGRAVEETPRIQRMAPQPQEAVVGMEDKLERLRRSRGNGRPLAEPLREHMASSLGADLSHVHVHTDGEADRLSHDLNAQAFTIGRDVYFAAGKYDPTSRGGQRLLAHELTHVVQQSGRLGGSSDMLVQRNCETVEECLEDIGRVQESLRAAIVEQALGPATQYGDEAFAENLSSAALGVLPDNLMLDLEDRAYAIAALTESWDETVYTIPMALQILSNLHQQAASSPELASARPSYGLEYLMRVMATRMADHLIGALGPDPDTHPLLAERAAWAMETIRDALSAALDALSDPEALMRLELEGTLVRIVELRAAYGARREQLLLERASASEELAALGQEIGVAARRALLLNQAMADLQPDRPGGDTPLDEMLVEEMAGEIAAVRQIAEDEEQSMAELGDQLELLAAGEIALDQPLFLEHLGPSYDQGENRLRVGIEPDWAFPRAVDAASNRFMRQLDTRIQQQRQGLESLRSDIVPDSYELEDFAAAFRRWFAFFSLEQERRDPTVQLVLGLMDDTYQLIGMDIHQVASASFLGTMTEVESGIARAHLMQSCAQILEQSMGAAAVQFAGQIREERLRAEEETGGWASEPEYEFAQEYGEGSESERGSREALLRSLPEREEQRRLGEAVRRLAQQEQARRRARERSPRLPEVNLPGSERRERETERTRVARAGGELIGGEGALPVYGLLNPQARQGWRYLIDVQSTPGRGSEEEGGVVAQEYRVMPTEVVRYLLAYRQHAETLRQSHTPTLPEAPHLPIGERAMREGGVERGEATGEARYVRGEVSPSPSRAAFGLRGTRGRARRESAIPTRPGSTYDPAEQAAWRLIADLERYFEAFYTRHPEPEYRMASVFIMAEIQFGVGGELMQLGDPSTIAEMAGEALRISLTIQTLNALGPLGRLASLGYRAYLGMQGTSEIAALISITHFLRSIGQVSSFQAARAWSHVARYIVDDVRELMEALVGIPARGAARRLFDAATTRPPSDVQQMVDLCRPLMENEESRTALMNGVETRIGELAAEGAGMTHENPEYNALILFRDRLTQQVSLEQSRLALDPEMGLPRGREETEEEVTLPTVGRLRSSEERAALHRALGDLVGRVPIVENPDAALGATVRVHYSGPRVWVEVGPEAGPRQISDHVETIRQLQRYEGLRGSIRRSIRRALGMQEIGLRGPEAEMEVEKLTRILGSLEGMQQRIDQRAARLTEGAARAEDPAEQEAIAQEIDDLRWQLFENLREIGSTEQGRGYVAAETTEDVRRRLTERSEWTEEELEGLTQEQLSSLRQGALMVRVHRETGLSFSDIEALNAQLESGDYWQVLPSGVLRLYNSANREPEEFPEAYRPFLSGGRQPEPRLRSSTWPEAFAELCGENMDTSFARFVRMLDEQFGVGQDEIINQMQRMPGGGTRTRPSKYLQKTIRSSVKTYYRETVIMPYITCQDVDLNVSQIVSHGVIPFSTFELGHTRMLNVTQHLAPEDVGVIAARWHHQMYTGGHLEVGFSPEQMAAQSQAEGREQAELTANERQALASEGRAYRNFDVVSGNTAYEIKRVAGALDMRAQAEFADHLQTLGGTVTVRPTRTTAEERRITRLVWVMLHPSGVQANADWIYNSIDNRSNVSFEIFNQAGERRTLTRANRVFLLDEAALSEWLGVSPRQRRRQRQQTEE